MRDGRQKFLCIKYKKKSVIEWRHKFNNCHPISAAAVDAVFALREYSIVLQNPSPNEQQEAVLMNLARV